LAVLLALVLSLAAVPSAQASGFGRLKARLASGADASLLWIADSTGFTPAAPPRAVAQALAARFPTHTVRYRRWAEWRDPPGSMSGPVAYDPPEIIGRGTTRAVLDVWNATLPGRVPQSVTGARFAAAVLGPRPDAVVWLHGHNLLGEEPRRPDLLGAFWGPIGTVGAALPEAGQVALVQNPSRAHNRMAEVLAALQQIAATAEPPVTVVAEGYEAFLAAGRPAAFYVEDGADPTHPTPVGYAALVRALMAAFDGAPARAAGAAPAWPDLPGRNLLAAGNPPAGWTAEDGSLRQVVPAGPLRGRRLTLAVRLDDPGIGEEPGRLAVEVDGRGGGTVAASRVDPGRGGSAWLVLADIPVPLDATRIAVVLPGPPVRIERAILVEGARPRGLAAR
jgi:hypothetical protein